MALSIFAISLGAAAGALSRWVLGLSLNAALPALPMGTLVANLSGGYLIGLALAYGAHVSPIAPHWQLLFVTGFLGSLTTFSTFSAEVLQLLQQGRVATGLLLVALHLAGSLLATWFGYLSIQLARRLV